MQFITREITSYRCTFGRYDLSTNTMTDLQTMYFAAKPGPRKMAELSEQYGVCADVSEIKDRYCMPVDLFVKVASEWMEEHPERPSHMKNDDGETTLDSDETINEDYN